MNREFHAETKKQITMSSFQLSVERKLVSSPRFFFTSLCNFLTKILLHNLNRSQVKPKPIVNSSQENLSSHENKFSCEPVTVRLHKPRPPGQNFIQISQSEVEMKWLQIFLSSSYSEIRDVSRAL